MELLRLCLFLLRIYNVAVGSSSLFSKCLLYSVVRFVMGVSSRPFSDSYDSVPFLLSILNARAKIDK